MVFSDWTALFWWDVFISQPPPPKSILMLSDGVRKTKDREIDCRWGSFGLCMPGLCYTPSPVGLLARTTTLKFTLTFGHACRHTMYTLNHIIKQPLNSILLPICSPPPLPALCPKTHRQGNHQHSGPPRHPGKVSEDTHTCTKSHTQNVRPFLWITM